MQRSLLEQKLKACGWNLNFSDINRDVFQQKPRTDDEKKLLGRLSPDFCLYLGCDSNSPEIIIETKKPGVSLSKAKEQAMKYAVILGSKIIILYDGLIVKSYWVENAKHLKNNGVELNDVHQKDDYRQFIQAQTNEYNDNQILITSKEDLINVFAFTNQKLRKAGISKGIERFFEFSNLLFLKLISENNQAIANNIPTHLQWDAYKNKTGQELLDYINDTVINKLETIFNRNNPKNYQKNNRNTLFKPLIINDALTLKQIIDKLDRLNFSEIKTDIKGDAFEYFIQKYNTSNNDLGEYFTPRHIVNFLVALANPVYSQTVYDPFCGTGGILISAFHYIKDKLVAQGYLTATVLADLKENTVYGSEISSNARVAKMNMILTGDGHSNILQQDSLKNPVAKKYDIVITNIPFNLEGSADNLYSLLSDNGNTQSIQHIIDSLIKKTTSRAFVIVPDSVLNNPETTQLRKHLIDNNLITQIISLPAKVFLPYTEAKASILVLQSYNNARVDSIKITRIKTDGFTLTQRRRSIDDKINDLEEYLSDNNYNSNYISVQQIKLQRNYSFIWFKYIADIPAGCILLADVLAEERIVNTNLHPTVTITKSDFYGIVSGEDYWGDTFASVTSQTNADYHIVNPKSIAYNPSRANTGSLGINLSKTKFAVSKMYVIAKVINRNFLAEYVYLYLKSKEGIANIVERSFGTVRQSLKFDDLCTIPIPQIAIEKQRKLIANARHTYKKYKHYQKQLCDFSLNDE